MAALREACPSAEEQEADRAFIRQLKERHDRVKGATWRDKAKPATRRLLDQIFAMLGLEHHDPDGKLRLYLSIYDPAAIRRAAAIVAARLARGLLDPAFAHRYLVKVIQAQQVSLDLEREELMLLRLARQSAQDWVSAETEEYEQLKRELQSQPLDLACALAERAAEGGIPVAAAFWTERLLENVGASRHLLGAVRRFLVRLYEAPADRRLSLIDRLVALEWGVS